MVWSMSNLQELVAWGPFGEKRYSVDPKLVDGIKDLRGRLRSISDLCIQYSVFVSSLTHFQKLIFSHALDMHELNNQKLFTYPRGLVEAEYLITSQAVTFIKFIELYPSLLDKSLPNRNLQKLATATKNALYDSSTSYYCFICELRNALTHNKVNIIYSRGGSRKFGKDKVGISTFGYFVHYNEFASKCCRQNKQALLKNTENHIKDRSGRVDIVRAFLETYAEVYNQLILPRLSELKAEFFSLEKEGIELISKVLPDDVICAAIENDDLSLMSGEEAIYDIWYVKRIRASVLDIQTPSTHPIISIAPSYQTEKN